MSTSRAASRSTSDPNGIVTTSCLECTLGRVPREVGGVRVRSARSLKAASRAHWSVEQSGPTSSRSCARRTCTSRTARCTPRRRSSATTRWPTTRPRSTRPTCGSTPVLWDPEVQGQDRRLRLLHPADGHGGDRARHEALGHQRGQPAADPREAVRDQGQRGTGRRRGHLADGAGHRPGRHHRRRRRVRDRRPAQGEPRSRLGAAGRWRRALDAGDRRVRDQREAGAGDRVREVHPHRPRVRRGSRPRPATGRCPPTPRRR